MAHTTDEVVAWFREDVMPTHDVWVAIVESCIVGVAVLSDGWVEQLYVDPRLTGHGIGAALLEHAKSRSAGQLDLWTFATNIGAKRFYERHGFAEVDRTDGDNEEGAPDIRYRWHRP